MNCFAKSAKEAKKKSLWQLALKATQTFQTNFSCKTKESAPF